MATTTITVAARCGHTSEQAINPGTEAAIRQVAAMFPCRACQAAVNPFAPRRRYGRGRMSSR